MAANVENPASADSEAYIEKYLRSVLAVENLLTLDRLRQEVAVKEQLTGKGKLSRRSISSPSMNRLSGSRQELSPSHSLGSNKGRWESQQDVSQTLVSRGIAPGPPALSVSPQNNQSPDPGLGGVAASYLNPVKSLVPQMPKLLKSLFPVRDDRRGRHSSPLAHQPVPRILVQPTFSDTWATRTEEAQQGSPGPSGALESMVKMAAPAVKICDKPVKVSSPPSPMVVTQPPEGQDGPPSPLSEASSGYFSHSVSSATLSETLTLGLDTTGLGSQTPGSPPALCQVTPEPELAFLSCTQSHPPAPEEAHVPAAPTQSTELEVPRAPLLSEPASAVPTSPFRIRKVRTSELKSFTGMLGGASSGAEEDPLASEDPSNARGQTLGRLEVTSDSEDASEVPEWLREGEYVVVGTNKTGIVRYIGPTDFQEGTWIGVELDLPAGKNDGSIGGKQYFRCNPGYGLLVRPSRVRRAVGTGRRRSSGLQPQGAPEVRRSATISGSATNLASLTAALAKGDRSYKNPENRKSWAS